MLKVFVGKRTYRVRYVGPRGRGWQNWRTYAARRRRQGIVKSYFYLQDSASRRDLVAHAATLHSCERENKPSHSSPAVKKNNILIWFVQDLDKLWLRYAKYSIRFIDILGELLPYFLTRCSRDGKCRFLRRAIITPECIDAISIALKMRKCVSKFIVAKNTDWTCLDRTWLCSNSFRYAKVAFRYQTEEFL